jgi:hypothetical protein
MGQHYEPHNSTGGSWSASSMRDCGFEFVDAEQLKRRLLFAPTSDGRPNTTHTICGDSTALGEYRYNLAHVINKDEGIFAKMEDNPKQLLRELIIPDPPARTTTFKFSSLYFVSTADTIVAEAIQTSGAGDTIVVVLGNWDMNWKSAKSNKRKIPGFTGARNLANAAVYWTKYVTKFLTAVDAELRTMPAARRPVIVIREMFLPYCNASRFTRPGRGYRQCPTVLRTVLAPMYRRVLSAMAWSMRIPVIRVDRLFRGAAAKYCAMPDGLHLAKTCAVHEHQLVWNALLLLKRANAEQGLREGDVLPNATHFVDAMYYGKWMRAFAAVHYNVSGSVLANGIPSVGLAGGSSLKAAAVSADEAAATENTAYVLAVSASTPVPSAGVAPRTAPVSAALRVGASESPSSTTAVVASDGAAAQFRKWHGGLHPLVLPCVGAAVAFALVWMVTKQGP